ncbi:MAG: type II toxin-antitoxin system RelE/ParE family toxin [Phaeodactylibacter sp.]|nr:type II toxin-antitoxin system RelE/ParE family toxin [Phaeodactylibacter sp.]
MPPKYLIRFLNIAREEINDAKAYLDEISPDLGDEFIAEVEEMLSKLEGNPYLFQKIHKEKRQALIKRFNYRLIYEIFPDNQIVLVLAVIHGSRHPKRWQNR